MTSDANTPQKPLDTLNEGEGLDTAGRGPLDDIPVSERRADSQDAVYKRSIYALPVNLQVVVGTARPTIAELLQMTAGSLVTLASKIDDPVDLCIDNRIIARGELIETDAATGSIGVRLTEIVDVSEDILS